MPSQSKQMTIHQQQKNQFSVQSETFISAFSPISAKKSRAKTQLDQRGKEVVQSETPLSAQRARGAA